MGSRTAVMSLLTFADKMCPKLWGRHEEILSDMDLKGDYQRRNLRTAMAAMDVLGLLPDDKAVNALKHTAQRTGFHGRWDQISDDPWVICDIGHNEHGLKYNFAQLAKMKAENKCSQLIIVYGSVADKDVDAVIHLMPEDAEYVFTQARGKRALEAGTVLEKYLRFCQKEGRSSEKVHCAGTVIEAVSIARNLAEEIRLADPGSRPLIYIGGSTYVVSEAVPMFRV